MTMKAPAPSAGHRSLSTRVHDLCSVRAFLIASGVAIFCVALTIVIFVATRNSELSNGTLPALTRSIRPRFSAGEGHGRARDAFIDRADDVAAKVENDFIQHMRDLRVLSERVAVHIDITGSLPPRTVYQRHCEPLRANPGRIFSGLSLIVNISHDTRPRFEEWISIENNREKFIYYPQSQTMDRAGNDTWYGTNVYTTSGTESWSGFDYIRPGWGWSTYSEFRTLLESGRDLARVVTSAPVAFPAGFTVNTLFILFQSPIFINPELASKWAGNISSDEDRAQVLIAYCKNDTLCPSDVDQANIKTHPNVALYSQVRLAKAPLYGIVGYDDREQVGTAAPACVHDPAVTDKSTCRSYTEELKHLLEEHVMERKDMLYVGTISGSIYIDRVAWAALRRYRTDTYLIGCEDVTGVPGFELLLHANGQDEAVPAIGSYSWERMIYRNNGTLPYTSGVRRTWPVIEVPTGAGMVKVQQTAYSMSVWRYWGVPFSTGLFMFATDPRDGIPYRCENATYYTGSLATFCTPQLSPMSFHHMTSNPTFGQSYLISIGGRIWHLYIATPDDFVIDRETSTFSLIGGLITAFMLTCVTFGVMAIRNEKAKREAFNAAAKAHELTVSYACHELRNPLHALSAATALLGEELHSLEEAEQKLTGLAFQCQAQSADLALVSGLRRRRGSSASKGAMTFPGGSPSPSHAPGIVSSIAAAAAISTDVTDDLSSQPSPGTTPVNPLTAPLSTMRGTSTDAAMASTTENDGGRAKAAPAAVAAEATSPGTAATAALSASPQQPSSFAPGLEPPLAEQDIMPSTVVADAARACQELMSQLRDDTSTIAQACEQLHQVVNDFTDLQRLHTGRFELRVQPARLRPLLKRTVDLLSPLAPAHIYLWVHRDVPSQMLIDQLRVQQIVSNGLTNACKYSKPDTDIYVCVWPATATSRVATVGLTDHRHITVADGANSARGDAAQAASSGASPPSLLVGSDETAAGRMPFSMSPSSAAGSMPTLPQHSLSIGGDDVVNPAGIMSQMVSPSTILSQQSPTTLAAAMHSSLGSSSVDDMPPVPLTDVFSWRPENWHARKAPPAAWQLGAVAIAAAPAPAPAKPSMLRSLFLRGKAGDGGMSSAHTQESVDHGASVHGGGDDDKTTDAARGTLLGYEPFPLIIEINNVGMGLLGKPGCELFQPFVQGGAARRLAAKAMQRGRQGTADAAHAGGGADGTHAGAQAPSNASTRAKLGSGLGLSLTASLVTMMDGTVGIADIAGRTRFVACVCPLASRTVGSDSSRPELSSMFSSQPNKSDNSGGAAAAAGGAPVGMVRMESSGDRSMDGGGEGHGMLYHSSGAAGVWAAGLTTSDLLCCPSLPAPTLTSPLSSTSPSALQQSASSCGQTCARDSRNASSVTAIGSDGMHVLVVEDDATNRKLVARMLQRINCTFEMLEDGDQVADELEATGQLLPAGGPLVPTRRPYDLVLMDIVMVRSNGAAVSSVLKARNLSIPIYPMTANTSAADTHMYKSSGMEELLVAKPFTLQRLAMVVDDAKHKKHGSTGSGASSAAHMTAAGAGGAEHVAGM